MASDEVIWQHVNHGHCSFRYTMKPQNFCRNTNNVSGLCNRKSCPLANSNYATIKEHEGKCYLHIKVIERQHLPSRLWEKIELSSDYLTALKQVEARLQYFNKFQLKTAKIRLTKMHQYLVRLRKMRSSVRPKLVHINKTVERRLNKKEVKALRAANISKTIKAALMKRLKGGVYEGIYNFPQEEFHEVCEKNEEVSDEEVDSEEAFIEAYEDLEDIAGREIEFETEHSAIRTVQYENTV